MPKSTAPIDRSKLHCSLTSQVASEPLHGTAPRTDYWILVEYNQPPGAKAVQESTLPENIKVYLTESASALPNSRLLLIKQQPAQSYVPIHLFLGRSSDQDPTLYRFKLDSYEDILSVPIVDILASSSDEKESLKIPSMYLVCTNGKRDICCARWGIPVNNAFQQIPEVNAWQTSHVGGHRFGPNVVSLPHGIYYGRVTPEDVNEITRIDQNNEIDLKHYRGRACYPAPAQAAEYFLRRESDQLRINHYSMISIDEGEGNTWGVVFQSQQSGDPHTVIVESYTAEYNIFESCAKPDKLVAPEHFRLVSIQHG